jgi:pyroglutamyl-peptidase
MGSEAPPSPPPPPAHPNLVIHITGFKRFHGVDRNPTESIMIALKEALRKKAGKDGIIDSESCPESFHLPPGIRIGSITVLETAGYYALPVLEKLLDSALTEKQQQQQQKETRNTTDGSMESDEQIVWVQ